MTLSFEAVRRGSAEPLPSLALLGCFVPLLIMNQDEKCHLNVRFFVAIDGFVFRSVGFFFPSADGNFFSVGFFFTDTALVFIGPNSSFQWRAGSDFECVSISCFIVCYDVLDRRMARSGQTL